jgi:hypothetical protein
MPPDPWSFKRWKQLKEDWDLLKQQMVSHDITIPEYRADGLFFSIDPRGRCITEKLTLDSTQKLLEPISKLLAAVDPI